MSENFLERALPLAVSEDKQAFDKNKKSNSKLGFLFEENSKFPIGLFGPTNHVASLRDGSHLNCDFDGNLLLGSYKRILGNYLGGHVERIVSLPILKMT